MEKYIGLWLDRTSDPSEPKWIVSRDTDDTTDTIVSYAEDDYAAALRAAQDECQRTGYPVVEIGEDGGRETIYEIDRPVWDG